MNKKLKIEFAPGCFDSFEGTQEELDQLISEIHQMFENGDVESMSQEIDLDELMEDDPELAEKVFASLADIDEPNKRTLQ